MGGAGAGGAARARRQRRRRRRVRGGACARLRAALAPLVPREGALEARLLLPAQLGDELARHVRAPLRLEVGGGAVLDELKVGHLAREGAADARLQHRRRVRLEREPPALAHPAVRRLDRDRRAAVLLEVGERAVPPPAARDAVGRLLLGHPVPLEHRHERGAPARAGVAHVAKRLERRERERGVWVGGCAAAATAAHLELLADAARRAQHSVVVLVLPRLQLREARRRQGLLLVLVVVLSARGLLLRVLADGHRC